MFRRDKRGGMNPRLALLAFVLSLTLPLVGQDDIRGLWMRGDKDPNEKGISHFYGGRIVYSRVNLATKLIDHTVLATYDWLPLDGILKTENLFVSKNVGKWKGYKNRWRIKFQTPDIFTQKLDDYIEKYSRIASVATMEIEAEPGFRLEKSSIDGVWFSSVSEGWKSMRILDQGRISETHFNANSGEATGQFLGVFSYDEKSKTITERPILATKDWEGLIGSTRQHKFASIQRDSMLEKVGKGNFISWGRPLP